MDGKRNGMRGAPFGLRPCRVRKPSNITHQRCGVVGDDPCVVPFLVDILVNGCQCPYTSAEIPPAGAPSGFDSAAVLIFIA